MTPYYHALSSVKKWGGIVEDYIDLHNWFDETKQYTGDWTHRALRHHSAGIEWAIQKFSSYIINSDNKAIPTKLLAEQHVIEDCGFIPTVQDYLKPIKENPSNWMLKVKIKHTETLKID